MLYAQSERVAQGKDKKQGEFNVYKCKYAIRGSAKSPTREGNMENSKSSYKVPQY